MVELGDGLNIGSEREVGIQNNSNIYALSNGEQYGGTITKKGRTNGEIRGDRDQGVQFYTYQGCISYESFRDHVKRAIKYPNLELIEVHIWK